MPGGGSQQGIQIFLRLRPSKKPSGWVEQDEADNRRLKFHVPLQGRDLIVNNTRTDYRFKFNGILGMEAGQEEVFDKVGSQAVINALDGFNSTIFAYGQTGSGKTFTITGGSERYVDRGIIPRAISMLFAEFKSRTDVHYNAFISYLEIYNETGYDLLSAEHETGIRMSDMKKVSLLEDEDGRYHLKNLSMHPVASEEDALNCLFLGDTNRAISETDMNLQSSRSHCVFTISIEGRKQGEDSVRRSKLHLVDLAGSERVGKSGTQGQTLKEAKYINSSLFYLEMVIVALHEKATKGRAHIPYRNSMMTNVLRDSLGGNCKTVMVATISPDERNTDESISTCDFAQRVALVKNEAVVNEDLDPELLIRRLKGELSLLREEIKFMKGEAGEGYDMTDEQREDLRKKVSEYVEDRDEGALLNIGQLTVMRIKDAFAIFKNFVLEERENAGTGGSGIGEDGEKIISGLKNSLQQRDNEIKILVNMVKQGKRIPGTPSLSGAEAKGRDGGEAESKHDRRNPNPINKEENRERIIQQLSEKLVNGVKVCKEKEVLEDPQKAFLWFKERYPGNKAIEENKVILKKKYTAAKATGEMVNKARGNINYLKTTIEGLRRERAMEKMVEGGDEDEGAEEGKGDDEEEGMRAKIEREKKVYKEQFGILRGLKSEIEHIQRLLEKSRTRMQQDFDTWYKNSEEFNSRYGGRAVAQRQLVSRGQENLAPPPAEPKSQQAWGNISSSSGGAEGGGGEGKLTGNKEADDDIRAFFKAKEELMKRRAGGAK